ncbi:MAG: hypothetical protein QM796_18485 [Chthoniobacteraceae bacterium]
MDSSAVIARLPSHHAEVVELIRRHHQAQDLVTTNPALAFCIANADNWDTRRLTPIADFQAHLLQVRRRQALHLLGFPGQENVVRILAKITPEACSLPLLLRLRKSLTIPLLQELLQHLRIIDLGAMFLAAYWHWPKHATPALFNRLAILCQDGEMPLELKLFNSAVHLLRHFPDQQHRRFQTIKEVETCRESLLQRHFQLEEPACPLLGAGDFPVPPIPGTSTIIPLSTIESLEEEGELQHHCVADYEYSVRRKELYCYRVLKPERATLAIFRSEGRWLIHELLGAGNSQVSERTVKAVTRWLNSGQRSR